MDVWTLSGASAMNLETKFLRLRTPVTIGSRFDDWHVCWGGWGKYRLYYLVMVVKLPRENFAPPQPQNGSSSSNSSGQQEHI
jgi:hypothetical protein